MKALRWILATVLLSGLVLPLVATYLDLRCGGSGACVSGFARWMADVTFTPTTPPHSPFEFWFGIALALAIGGGGYLILRRLGDWDYHWPYFRATQFTVVAAAIVAVVHLVTPWLTIGDRTIEDWLALVLGAVVGSTIPVGYLLLKLRERAELRERIILSEIRSAIWEREYERSGRAAADRARRRTEHRARTYDGFRD